MMTELQYMLAANIARVRALKAIVETVDDGDEIGIEAAEHDAMHALLLRWEKALDARLHREMGDEV